MYGSIYVYFEDQSYLGCKAVKLTESLNGKIDHPPSVTLICPLTLS